MESMCHITRILGSNLSNVLNSINCLCFVLVHMCVHITGLHECKNDLACKPRNFDSWNLLASNCYLNLNKD